MRTLECQKQRLESEIIASKESIWQIRESEFPDLSALNQLYEAVERNMQLINMIDRHLYAREENVFLSKQQQSG